MFYKKGVNSHQAKAPRPRPPGQGHQAKVTRPRPPGQRSQASGYDKRKDGQREGQTDKISLSFYRIWFLWVCCPKGVKTVFNEFSENLFKFIPSSILFQPRSHL